MPSILDQSPPSSDSTSGKGRRFSRFFNEYCAVTTATSGENPRTKRAARFFPRGGSRISLLAALRCRCHRHLPRPLGVYCCVRGVGVADGETLRDKCRWPPASEVPHEVR